MGGPRICSNVFLSGGVETTISCGAIPDSAESRVRALALLWNFCPSSPETVRKYAGQACPAERLNGKRYADNWLENLLVSGSMNGVEQDPQSPL